MNITEQHFEPSVTQVRITEEERLSGVPDPLTIEKALEALHHDGCSTHFPF
jgi:hypothetical protein